MKKFLFLLMAVFSAVAISAQTRTVTGVVTSSDGEPIVGASVLVEGTSLGAQTDLEGRFSIKNVPSDAKSLRVSYVGMTSREVAIIPGEIKIVLSLNSEMLEEVVVTAMGISRSEKSLGYSATQVGAAEIEKAQTTNVMTALQGKVAGLQIQRTSTDPGMANSVQIRGLGSINGSNEPLYVVDGVPMANTTLSSTGHVVATSGVANIAPDDIASLTVLKGAAATALYGSRASNGVIIITTKNGSQQDGKNFELTYSGNVEASTVLYLPEMQNRWGQGWNGSQTVIENGSWGPVLNGSIQPIGPIYDYDQLFHYYSAQKNNVRDFFDTGWSQNHNVALSGVSKDKTMNYYASYSYTSNDGIIPTDHDSYRRNTIALRGSYQPEKWIKVSTNMNLATYKTQMVGSWQGASVIDGIYEMPRDVSTSYLKDLRNVFNTPQAYYTPYGITNPYWALENNSNVTQGKQVYGKLQLDLMPISDLTLTYRFGFDYSDYDAKIGYAQIEVSDDLINNDYGYPPSSMNEAGSIYAYYSRSYELNHDFLASYSHRWLDNRLDFNAIVGLTLNERGSTYTQSGVSGLAVESGWWDLTNGSSWDTMEESQSKRRLVGLFGDFNFGWDDFLFLDVTMRNDWSSTLPIGHNSFFYPGVTLSGVFTRWIENKEVLSFGKIRLAYGKTGNDAAPYRTITQWAQAYSGGYYTSYNTKFPYGYNSTNAFMQSATAGARDLRPEMTTEFEIGTNIKLFNGRIDIDASYYNRDTKDQIFSLPIDPSTGFSTQVVNFGTVRNRGIELMVNFTPVQSKDWEWNIGFNWSKNWNKVLSLPEGLDGGKVSIYGFAAGADNVTMYAEEGKALGQFYTYLPIFDTNPNSPTYGAQLVDRYGQPILTSSIQDTGMNMQHKWTGGVTTSLRWKSLTLSAALDVRFGGYMFSRTKNLMQFTGNGAVTSYNDRLPFVIPNSVYGQQTSNGEWVSSGVENITPIYAANSSLQTYFNDYGYGAGGLAYMVDRSFAKLRNLSLTWSIPYKWLSKIYLKQVDLTLYGNNLFMWTSRGNRYVDPESTTVTGYGDLGYGFGELYTNPSSRQYGVNLKVTF